MKKELKEGPGFPRAPHLLYFLFSTPLFFPKKMSALGLPLIPCHLEESDEVIQLSPEDQLIIN